MYRLKIEHDNDALNPRVDRDNADIMYCEHRRYDLGDDDADNPYTEVSFVELRYQRADGTNAAYVLEDDDTEGEGLRCAGHGGGDLRGEGCEGVRVHGAHRWNVPTRRIFFCNCRMP